MNLGMREILWLAIGLLGVYVAVQLYRVLRLGVDHAGRRDAAKPAGDDAAVDSVDSVDSVVYGRPRPAGGETPAGAERFQLELEVQQLRRDVGQLRAELDGQRKDIAELAARLAQREQAEASAATKGASPEYDEALVYARRGLDVETIAQRCGITVAEAALVRTLAQGETGAPGPRS